MNITSGILADTRDQASSTGYIIDRLSSFNLSSGAVHHLNSSAVWEKESHRNTKDLFEQGHFSCKSRKYGTSSRGVKNLFEQHQHQINSLVDQTLDSEEKGMPRSKRKASVPQAEDVSRHSSKRFKTNSRRQPKTNDASHQTAFSEKQCTNWFREYTTPDDPETLGPEGMEKFCEDIGVEPENVLMLVIAYKMNAQRMGYFTHKEWLTGLTDMQCDSITKLQQKMDYLRDQLNDQATFRKIYRYAYDFARDKDQRSMDTETARIMLQLLLGKHWSLLTQFSTFLKQSKYKVINKDQWSNIFEFSRTIHDDLSNYDLDGAWPVMLDEFVVWQRAQTQTEEATQMDTRCS